MWPKKLKPLLISLAILLSFDELRAAPSVKSSQLLIDTSVHVDFIPDEAFLIIEMEGREPIKVRALLVPPLPENEGGANRDLWTVGAQINVPDEVGTLDYSLVLKGKDEKYSVIPGLKWRSSDVLVGDPQELGSILQQRRELLSSWQVQVKAQEENLRRLRMDADTIANVSRIVDVVEQTEAAKYEIENLKKNLENLRELFKQAKDQKTPKNYVRRELELTKQISELASAVKDAEGKELGRRSQSQSDLQKKLAIVEATRLEDPQKLLEDLARIRQRRISLENTGVKSPPTGDTNYWDIQ